MIVRNRRGFTLLETMLALVITALVLSVVYESVRSTSRNLRSVSVRNELYRSAFALLEEMGRELASAYLSPNGHPLNGTAITYFYVLNKEEDSMPQDELYFTTFGHAFSPVSRGESDQGEICYKPHYNRTRNELVLLKKEDATLDDDTCKDENLTNWDLPFAELPVPVATGIHSEKGTGYRLVGFQVECYGKPSGEDEEPLEEWDTSEKRTLPSRVKVTLTYEDGNENLIPFTKTVLLRLKK